MAFLSKLNGWNQGKKTILHEITQSQKDKYGMWYHLYMEAGHATIHIIAEVMYSQELVGREGSLQEGETDSSGQMGQREKWEDQTEREEEGDKGGWENYKVHWEIVWKHNATEASQTYEGDLNQIAK